MLGYESDRPTNTGGPVALFDSAGNILAQVTVGSTDTLIDGFYYKAITPITLTVGATYYIGAWHGTGPDWVCRAEMNTAEVPSYIQDLGTKWYESGSINVRPSWASSDTRHYTGNFQAHQVP